jgi:O-antigen ligase
MDWWRYSLPVFLERPFWGYGAYAGGRFVVLAALSITLSSSIHNTWLEVLLGTGLLGLLPLLAAFAWAWLLLIRPRPARPWNPPDQRLHAEAIGIFTVLSARSMFTATLIWHPPLMFLLVMVYTEWLRRGRQTAEPSAQPADPSAVRARKRSPPSRPAD